MEKIIVKPLFHRGKECVGLYFRQSILLNRAVQRVAGAMWSHTHKCFWMHCGEGVLDRLRKAVAGLAELVINGRGDWAERDSMIKIEIRPKPVKKPVEPRKNVWEEKWKLIRPVNRAEIEKMRERLVLKAYSQATKRTYLQEMRHFMISLGEQSARTVTPDELRAYLMRCFEELKLSINTMHSRINALKFYYENLVGWDRFVWEIPRPKKELQLPKVLSEEELERLFNALPNIKHKALLFTVYAAGLRVSEVVNLKLTDIDSKRMQIFVRCAKGKKDRFVPLSVVLLDVLHGYLRKVPVRPKVYLFESSQTGKAYPTRTAQRIFENAMRKARISKDVGIHSLRHSFATHMLEKGVDIRYIKDILGHFDIKTTVRYLHVRNDKLINFGNPLDDLFRRGHIEW